MIVKVIIGLLLLSSISSLECPLTSRYQSALFSGNTEIQSRGGFIDQDIDVNIPFERTLGSFPQIALSMNSLGNQRSGIIEFNIRVTNIQKNQFSFQVKSGRQSKWTNLKVHYLVSTRQDIEFGETQISEPNYNYQDIFIISYKPKITPEFTTQITPFISGLEVVSQDNQFIGIKFEKFEVTRISINFFFSSFNEDSIVNYIKIGVILFNNQQNAFLSTFNYFEKYNVEKKEEVDVRQNNIQSLGSYMIGIISFQVSISVPISIFADFTKKFTLQFGTNFDNRLDYIGISYVVFEPIGCGQCESYPYIYRNLCFNSCPEKSTPEYGYCIPSGFCGNGYRSNSFGQCIPDCGENAEFKSGHCICNEGYYKINEQCQQCPLSYMFNYKTGKCQNLCGQNADYNETDERCYCHRGYYVLTNGKTNYCGKCKSNETFDNVNKVCLGQCKANQVKDGDQCKCLSGYNRISGKCVKCPKESQFNSLFGICVCSAGFEYSEKFNSCIRKRDCDSNEIYSAGQCICKSGYQRIYGKCSTCPDNSKFDQSTGFCSCTIGYSLTSQGKCVRVNICNKPNEKIASDRRCVCETGYARDQADNCVPNNFICPQNQTKVNEVCVCVNGYSRNPDGFCYKIECSPGQQYNKNSGKCVPLCPFGQQYSTKYFKCIPSCKSNEEWNGRQCVCKDGFKKNIYNLCVQDCGYGQQRNSIGICVCKLGFKVYRGYCEPASCPLGQIYDPNFNKCVVRCRQSNQIWVNNKCVCISGYQFNQYGQCETACPENYHRQFGICKCKPGYYQSNGRCIPEICLNNQVWNPTLRKCVQRCPINSHWEVYRCECDDGFIRNNRNQCVKKCGQNEQLNGVGQCVCKPYFHRVNGFCVSVICPLGQQFDLSLQKCIPKCSGPFQIWQGQICVCIDGYEPYGTNCVPKCGENKERRNGQCVCKLGYRRNVSGKCVRQFCEAGQIRNQTGHCVDRCVKTNEKWDSVRRTCVCENGYQRDRFFNCVAVSCPIGTSRNSFGICVDLCKRQNEVWNQTLNKCVCKENYVKDGFGRCVIVCPQGKRSNDRGQCVDICPRPNQRWKSTVGMCVCIDGYSRVGGICQRRCIKSHEIWNQTLSRCVCKKDFYRDPGTGFCYPNNCGANQRPQNGKCVCINGYYNQSGVCIPGTPQNCSNGLSYDPATNKCICKPPKVWIFGKCITLPGCPPNSFWNGNACECKWGYIKRNNGCVPISNSVTCPPNSFYNGLSCLCKPGYFPINNQTCSACPTSTSWNGTNCTTDQRCEQGYQWDSIFRGCIPRHNCGANQFWDGIICRCKFGYFWINNSCRQCPFGKFFDGKLCVSNYLVPKICPGPYQFWNGNFCACIPGYFRAKDLCVKCPEIMQWNGYKCQPNSIFSLANTDFFDQGSNTVPATID